MTIIPEPTKASTQTTDSDVDGIADGVSPTSLRERVEEPWKDSPFAIGQTKLTWGEEDVGCQDLCTSCCNPANSKMSMHCTAFICSRLGAGRVGNMVVLWQSSLNDKSRNDVHEEGETRQRPKLRLVVGPYWTVTLLVTVPFIVLLSVLVFFRAKPQENTHVFIAWCISTAALAVSLFKVSTTDPGIMYRYPSQPALGDDTDEEWVWNDQAHTFRPRHAKFDPEIQAVVSHYDHTCPWTGTAIGGRNLFWFRSFLCFIFTTVIFDLILLAAAR